MAARYLASISHYIPEMLLCLTMVIAILIESTYSNDKKGSEKLTLYSIVGVGMLGAFAALMRYLGAAPVKIFSSAVVIDSFSTMAKMIMIFGAGASIYLAKESKDIAEDLKGEFVILTVGILVGGMLLASANNMLIFYIGIETLSILSYVMASMKKNDERSSEAGLKYSLYGGITAGMMLFGMSHIFGILGTIQFSEIIPLMQNLSQTQAIILMPAFLLFFAGIGYKIAAVPFHMWTPDVYEGSPLPVTTFFSIVPKIAGIVAFVRVTSVFFGGDTNALTHTWTIILMIASALTMTVGNVTAIGQRSVKRMLAYSSISHAGVMMMGVLVLGDLGTRAILFYGVTYLFMTLVAFYVTSFVQDHYGNDHFERFSGLMYKHPLMSILLVVTMFSLAGVPPLAGFVAKFNILAAVISKKYYMLATIAVLNSVVSLYYYLKIVRIMVFKDSESDEKIPGFHSANTIIIAAMSVPVLLLGVFWETLLEIANGASIYIN